MGASKLADGDWLELSVLSDGNFAESVSLATDKITESSSARCKLEFCSGQSDWSEIDREQC